jgi:hypothetical protein
MICGRSIEAAICRPRHTLLLPPQRIRMRKPVASIASAISTSKPGSSRFVIATAL